MSSFILSTVTSQLPVLIEKFEPEIESALVTALTKLKGEHPDKAQIFLDNWRKLNVHVEGVLASGGRRKRTRRHKRKTRKH
jgi:hypothetical protein